MGRYTSEVATLLGCGTMFFRKGGVPPLVLDRAKLIAAQYETDDQTALNVSATMGDFFIYPLDGTAWNCRDWRKPHFIPSPAVRIQHNRDWLNGWRKLQGLGTPLTWDQIPGMFDYERLYDEAAARAADGSVLVELGSYRGRSVAYLARALERRGVGSQLWAVDTWQDAPDAFEVWQANMVRAGVAELVQPLRMDSAAAATRFADGSVDFVFVDADHNEAAVRADIASWLPKIRPGGVMAGHDYDLAGVRRAVAALLPRHRTWERCWIVDDPTAR
jgi:hypothetical protein